MHDIVVKKSTGNWVKNLPAKFFLFPFCSFSTACCSRRGKKKIGNNNSSSSFLSHPFSPFVSHTACVSTCMLGATRKIVIMCIIERAFEEMRYCWGMSESSTLLSTFYDDMQVVMIVRNSCLLCGFTLWIVDWNELSFVGFWFFVEHYWF